jgi:hypothetical protein
MGNPGCDSIKMHPKLMPSTNETGNEDYSRAIEASGRRGMSINVCARLPPVSSPKPLEGFGLNTVYEVYNKVVGRVSFGPFQVCIHTEHT